MMMKWSSAPTNTVYTMGIQPHNKPELYLTENKKKCTGKWDLIPGFGWIINCNFFWFSI